MNKQARKTKETNPADVDVVEETGQVERGHPDRVPDAGDRTTIQKQSDNLLVAVSTSPSEIFIIIRPLAK